MSAHPRKVLKELQQWFSEYGIVILNDEYTKRHRKLRIAGGGKEATIIISISPSDRRTYHNIVKSAKSALREAR